LEDEKWNSGTNGVRSGRKTGIGLKQSALAGQKGSGNVEAGFAVDEGEGGDESDSNIERN
jgi:hypothetical protein